MSIGSHRVFTTAIIRIVQVMTQLKARNLSFAHNYWSGHCRTGRTYCYGPGIYDAYMYVQVQNI